MSELTEMFIKRVVKENQQNVAAKLEELMEPGKFYCATCFKDGAINELMDDPDDENKILPPNCGHFGKHWYKTFLKDGKRVSTKGTRKDQAVHANTPWLHVCEGCGYEFCSI